jgi:hypothetical protein
MRFLLVAPALAVMLLSACSEEERPSGTLDSGVAGTDGAVSVPDAGSNDSDAAQNAPDSSRLDAGSTSDAAAPADSGVMLGEPIDVPDDQWSWVNFPDSFCDDGTPTGIGIRPSSTSSNVLIFMNGGGACWDWDSCVVFNTSTHGPFGSAQFAQLAGGLDSGAFSTSNANNVFRDWNMIFVPYCTGDVHGGDNVATYARGDEMRQFFHVGRANYLAFAKRLAATFPSPAKLVLSGSSAGGFGASFNYVTTRTYWPTGQVYLIDDSGPALAGDRINPNLRNAWFQSWDLGTALDENCGVDCRTDFSIAYTRLSERYPNDRFALLSSLRDQVIRTYFGLSPTTFESALLEMSAAVIDPLPNFRYFFTTGEEHTMLGAPDQFETGGVDLFEWMQLMVTDDAGWESLKP